MTFMMRVGLFKGIVIRTIFTKISVTRDITTPTRNCAGFNLVGAVMSRVTLIC